MASVLWLFFFFVPFVLSAQELLVSQLDTRNGLPSNQVYASFQDSKGLIWIGTDMGVARYDGAEMQVFNTQHGLNHNEVYQFMEDAEGNIWMGDLSGGISIFKPDDSFEILPLSETISKGPCCKIFRDSKKRTWIINYRSIYVIGTNKKEIFKVFNEIPYLGVWEYKNQVYILSFDGIYLWNEQAKRLDLVQKHIMKRYFTKYLFENGTLYFLDEETIYKATAPNFNISIFKKFDFVLLNIHKANDSTFYLPSYNGLYSCDQNGENLTKYLSCITTFYSKDYEGNSWISTLGSGIYMAVDMGCRHYKLPSNIYSFFQQNQELWLGANYPVVWKVRENQLIQERLSESIKHAFRVMQITKDPKDQDTYWICGGASLTRKKNGKSVVRAYDAKSLAFCSRDSMYLACGGGLIKLNKNDFEWTNRIETIYRDRTNIVFFDEKNKELYVGTIQGLKKYKDDVEQKLPTNAFFKGQISKICQIDDEIWFSSLDAGIAQLKNGEFEFFNRNNLLPSSQIITMAIQPQTKNIWFSCSEGIFILDRKKKCKPAPLPIPTHYINLLAFDKQSLYIGSGSDVWKLPLSIHEQQSQPKIYVKNIQMESSFSQNNILYGYSNFKLSFQALSFSSNKHITYRYRIKNIDLTWIETKNNHIEFPILAPGEYTLELYAENYRGLYSETTTITFVVLPKWYQTTQFKLLILAILFFIFILVIWAINYYYVNKSIQERKMITLERQQMELTQQTLRLQINPHFLFNALQTLQGIIQTNNSNLAVKFLQNLSGFFRKILLLSKDEKVHLSEEVETITQYLEVYKIRLGNKFDYRLEIQKDLETESIMILPLILQPIVENAIVHGVSSLSDGKIYIRIYESEDFLIFEVEDNGLGMKKSRSKKTMGTGNGIRITKERLTLIGGKIEIQELSQGTKIILYIPLDYSDF